MKSTLNKTNDVQGTIVIELEKKDYQEQVDKSLNKYRQKANFPGFRQGKVPKSLIRKLYGKAVLVEEINNLISEEIRLFIKEKNLNLLGDPLPADNLDEELDLENEETIRFSFDVALAPVFDLKLDKSIELTCYDVKTDAELIDRQIDTYKQSYGDYVSTEEEIKDTDLIKGTLTEMENGMEKENGQVVENAVLMPSYLKDEETRNSFIGAKKGDNILFSPVKAYDNNMAEVASLLQTTKEEAAKTDSDFRYEISDVTRYKEAEMNQELFDRIFGEGVVSSEEELREKIASVLQKQYMPNVNYFFLREAREIIVKMMEKVEFPDDLLKRRLKEDRKKSSFEEVEKEYPDFIESLKFHVAKQKIAEENEIGVEFSEVEEFAIQVAREQFAQYGITDPKAEVLLNYIKKMFEKDDVIRNLYDKVLDNKIIDWLKENVTVIKKEISTKDFIELINNNLNIYNTLEEKEVSTDTASEETVDSEQPDSNDTPSTGDEPDADKEPDAYKKPDADKEPDANKEPDTDKEPDANKEPDADEKPVKKQKKE